MVRTVFTYCPSLLHGIQHLDPRESAVLCADAVNFWVAWTMLKKNEPPPRLSIAPGAQAAANALDALSERHSERRASPLSPRRSAAAASAGSCGAEPMTSLRADTDDNAAEDASNCEMPVVVTAVRASRVDISSDGMPVPTVVGTQILAGTQI